LAGGARALAEARPLGPPLRLLAIRCRRR
jgi:hypothetical protein